jgi:GNAT superfamily N-acetyltransferase
VPVRRAVHGDEATLRALRIEALTDSPREFGSTLERELARSASDWRRWITDGATFLYERGGEAQGIAAGVRHIDDPASAFLMAVWVRPEARGRKAADALVAAVIAWARAEGFADVWLHVARGNARARRVYERNGFRLTGREVVRDRDGVVEVEMRLVLADAAKG